MQTRDQRIYKVTLTGSIVNMVLLVMKFVAGILGNSAAIVASLLIFVTAFRLLRQASGELLEESLPRETENKIEQIVYEDPLARDDHNLHTRRIGSIIAIEMHLRLPGDISLSESHTHATEIEKRIKEEFGAGTHIMLHIEPIK